ncbi:surfeit locus protein 6 isoform X2 [Macaca thibetana thibetana]|uniref:surfeit locus protein 6 isoform X1 n=1 Tax=Macaca mulatta TaxID=9544 RepID=UPI0010A29C3B|nr:surfeit locus protein 6 isoform X1 [Macaca mulatta]XP_050616140.1 surfeit locus protein 6 isoform X2 [Macaca thibetana thibetana]
MASLLAKDAYLQSLAKKICSHSGPEQQARTRAGKTRGSEAAGPPKKKRKKTQKKFRQREEKAAEHKAKSLGEKSPAASGARRPEAAKEEAAGASSSAGNPADGLATEPESVFALDVLRQRLHEKIQEARGQVVPRSCRLPPWRKSGGESRNGTGRRGSERSCGRKRRPGRLRRPRRPRRRWSQPQRVLARSRGSRRG